MILASKNVIVRVDGCFYIHKEGNFFFFVLICRSYILFLLLSVHILVHKKQQTQFRL